jgi:hypothetical protein
MPSARAVVQNAAVTAKAIRLRGRTSGVNICRLYPVSLSDKGGATPETSVAAPLACGDDIASSPLGPVALRPRLSTGLPLHSCTTGFHFPVGVSVCNSFDGSRERAWLQRYKGVAVLQ